jgi:hypothetical protein
MHVVDRTERFTLVGSDARRGKLTLFAADGPRDPGVLSRVGLRVFDLDEALAALPADADVQRVNGRAELDAGEGLRLAFVEVDEGIAYDLDHVVFRVPDPDATFAQLAALGFEAEDEPPRRRVLIRSSRATGDSDRLSSTTSACGSSRRMTTSRRRSAEASRSPTPSTRRTRTRSSSLLDRTPEYAEHADALDLISRAPPQAGEPRLCSTRTSSRPFVPAFLLERVDSSLCS